MKSSPLLACLLLMIAVTSACSNAPLSDPAAAARLARSFPTVEADGLEEVLAERQLQLVRAGTKPLTGSAARYYVDAQAARLVQLYGESAPVIEVAENRLRITGLHLDDGDVRNVAEIMLAYPRGVAILESFVAGNQETGDLQLRQFARELVKHGVSPLRLVLSRDPDSVAASPRIVLVPLRD